MITLVLASNTPVYWYDASTLKVKPSSSNASSSALSAFGAAVLIAEVPSGSAGAVSFEGSSEASSG